MTFTITELWQFFLAFLASIITMGGAGAVMFKVYNYFKKPNTERDSTLKNINGRLEKHDEKLDNDNRRLKELEDSNKVIMRSMLALMSHAIDGNHTDELRKARDDMQEYLLGK